MKDHISICILTYRRNEMLENLLRKLALQETFDLFSFSVVVVDNDAKGLARETVERMKKDLDMKITYSIEPEQTIPAGRNHALRLGKGNYIGIIDDDEFPPQLWLATMYRALKAFDVDGVLGPVHPFFDKQPPSWLVKGKFCERPVHRTGTLLHWSQTRTGNVLLRRDVFDKHSLYFNEKFKTGGSDQEFFRQAMSFGWRFIAVEEAPVYEIVPPMRLGKSYYLKRALVNGFNANKYSTPQKDGLPRVKVFVKSSVALVIYILVLPFSSLFGGHVVMNFMEKGCHHLSRLLAILGIELIKKRDF